MPPRPRAEPRAARPAGCAPASFSGVRRDCPVGSLRSAPPGWLRRPAPHFVRAALLALALAGCSSPPPASAPVGGGYTPLPPPEEPGQVFSPPTPPAPPAGPATPPPAGPRPPVPPPGSRPSAAPSVSAAGLPAQRVNGVDYVDAATYLARLGLTRADLKAGNRGAVFQGGDRRVELDADDREARLDGLRVFLGEPVLLRGRALLVSRVDAEKLLGPILSPGGIPGPARPAPRTIMLDPGHGGEDSGTQNKPQRLDEKNLTLDVARRLKPLLEAAGHRVILTRDSDVFIPLPQRAALANDARADLFISIHFNSVANGPAVDGIETYLMTPPSQRSTASTARERADDTVQPGNALDPWNAVLAAALHRPLLAGLGADDRGLKHARFAVLQRLTTAPGVLVECGYLSNDAEARRIATPAHRQKIAQALADGVAAYSAQLAALQRP